MRDKTYREKNNLGKYLFIIEKIRDRERDEQRERMIKKKEKGIVRKKRD